MSSAILYGAIVVIWAGVLIPRWLRRDTSTAEQSPVTVEENVTDERSAPVDPVADSPEADPVADSPEAEPVAGEPPPARRSGRSRVVRARRRLLLMLLGLAIGSGVLAAMQLAAWWVVLPPSVMLVGYLGLLREASKADAERRAAAAASRHTARRSAPVTPAAPVVPVAPPVAADAEVIDITARVTDQPGEPGEQYPPVRAVGG